MTDPSSRETLSCGDVDACLHPFVDGELEADDRAELEGHMLGCSRCSMVVAELRAYKRRLRNSVETSLASERLRAALQTAIVHETSSRSRRALLPYVVWPLAAAALAAVVLISVREVRARVRTDELVEAAVENHQRDLPLEVRDSALPGIRSWFNGKVGFASNRIPQLGTAGVLGGRLSHLREADAAYVVYDTPNQRRVSLFVINAPGLTLSSVRHVANQDVMIANQHGYNVAIWKDQEIVYSLVSDLDERDILELIAASNH